MDEIQDLKLGDIFVDKDNNEYVVLCFHVPQLELSEYPASFASFKRKYLKESFIYTYLLEDLKENNTKEELYTHKDNLVKRKVGQITDKEQLKKLTTSKIILNKPYDKEDLSDT